MVDPKKPSLIFLDTHSEGASSKDSETDCRAQFPMKNYYMDQNVNIESSPIKIRPNEEDLSQRLFDLSEDESEVECNSDKEKKDNDIVEQETKQFSSHKANYHFNTGNLTIKKKISDKNVKKTSFNQSHPSIEISKINELSSTNAGSIIHRGSKNSKIKSGFQKQGDIVEEKNPSSEDKRTSDEISVEKAFENLDIFLEEDKLENNTSDIIDTHKDESIFKEKQIREFTPLEPRFINSNKESLSYNKSYLESNNSINNNYGNNPIHNDYHQSAESIPNYSYVYYPQNMIQNQNFYNNQIFYPPQYGYPNPMSSYYMNQQPVYHNYQPYQNFQIPNYYPQQPPVTIPSSFKKDKSVVKQDNIPNPLFNKEGIEFINKIILSENLIQYLCSPNGCKEMQRKFQKTTKELSEYFIKKIIEHKGLDKIMMDNLANYLLQKKLAMVSSELRIQVMNEIENQADIIGTNVCGTHSLQSLATLVSSDEEIKLFIDILCKNVKVFAFDCNGVHILLKALSSIKEDKRIKLNHSLLLLLNKLVLDPQGVCIVSYIFIS